MKFLVNVIQLSVLINCFIIDVRTNEVSQSCLQCICQASSGCKLNTKCHNSGPNAYFCGPYQISWAYWADAGKPENTGASDAFENCLNDKNCAEVSVRGYMNKWQKDCNNDGVIDCLDFAAIHKAGPTSCDQQWLYNSQYWNVFRQCQIGSNDGSAQPALNDEPWTPPETQPNINPQPRPQSRPLADPWPQTQPQSRPILKPQTYPNTGYSQPQPPAPNTDPWNASPNQPIASDPWPQPQPQPQGQPQPQSQPTSDESWSQPLPQPNPYDSANQPQPQPSINSQPQPYPNDPWTQPQPPSPARPQPQPPSDDSYGQPQPSAPSDPWSQPYDPPSQPSLESQPYSNDGYNQPQPQPQPVTDDPWDEISRAVDELSQPTPKPQIQPQPIRADPWNANQPQSPPQSVPGRAPTQPISWSSNAFGQPFKPLPNPNPNPKPPTPPTENNYTPINGSVDDNCLECICQASTDCDLSKQCEGSYCGPYLISWAYWSDSGQPGGDYVTCANNKGCSEQAVQGYMNKWQSDCNGDGVIDCSDFAAIHRLGPHSCSSEAIHTTDYWKSYESCASPPIDARRLQPTGGSLTGRSVPQSVPNANLFQEYPTPVQPNNNPVPRNAPNYINREDRVVFPRDQPNLSQPNTYGSQPANPSPAFPTTLNNVSFDKIFEELGLQRDCLDCICHASSKCNPSIGCQNDGSGGYVCGPYQVNWAYWSDAGKPGVIGNNENLENYQSCLNNKDCAEASIYAYMKKWKRDCNEDQQINCYDFAALHKAGPANCNAQWFFESQYWSDFRECFDFRRRK